MKLKTNKLVQLSLICFSLFGTMTIVNEVQNVDNNKKKNQFDTKQGRLNDPIGDNFVESWYFGQKSNTDFNIEISLDTSEYNYLRLWLLERIKSLIPFSVSEKTMQDFVASFVTGKDAFGLFTPELKSITKQLQTKLKEKSEAMSFRNNFFQDTLANWLTTIEGFGYFTSAFIVDYIAKQGKEYNPILNLLWKYDNGTLGRDTASEKIVDYYRHVGMTIELPFVETTGDLWTIDKTNLRTFPQGTLNPSVSHYYLQAFNAEGIKGPEIYIESKSTGTVYVRDALGKILSAIQKNFGLQSKDMDYIKIDSSDFNEIIPTKKSPPFADVTIDFLNTNNVRRTYMRLPILLARYAPSFV